MYIDIRTLFDRGMEDVCNLFSFNVKDRSILLKCKEETFQSKTMQAKIQSSTT